MINSSIVRKLISYFLLLNILTVIIVGSYSYYRAKDALVKRTFDQLTSLRIEKKYRIEKLFRDRLSDLSLVAGSEDVRDIISLMQEADSPGSEVNRSICDEYGKFLSKHLLAGKYYRRLFIIDNNEHSISFGTMERDTTMRYETVTNSPVELLGRKIILSDGIIIEDYKIDSNINQPAIFIGSPVTGPGAGHAGVIVFELDPEAINSIMYENNPHNGLGKSGESYLVGSDYLMRSTSRFQDNAVFKTTVNTMAATQALKGQTGTAVIDDYRGISVLSSYSGVDIHGLNWAVIVEIDEKEAMVPVYSIRNNILFLGVLISLLLFAIVYIIAIRISLPVIKLKEAAQKITSGNYDVAVESVAGSDEIGSLITAFNEMSAKIKEQTGKLNMERSMRLSSMIDGQELERLRLSRELHDGLGQSILAIKMRLERAAGVPPEKAKVIMEEVHQLFANVIEEIRSISNDLMPAELNQFGLTDALINLCREVNKSSGIMVEFRYDDYRVVAPDRVNTYLYRIAQEALNNIVKHSSARRAEITLDSGEEIALKISDDGCGFHISDERKLCGNGISNMRERVSLLGGEIIMSSDIGKGTTITIKIPIGSEG